MAVIKLKWSSLLLMSELDFIPEAPKILNVSDELVQTLSWLTAATRHDRRLLRCDENGALLVADAWGLFSSVETDELYPESGSEKTYTATVINKGVLIATSGEIIRAIFRRISGGDTETIYLSPNTIYWYPHTVYDIVVHTVPDPTGTASYIGITAFN
ncbi:hypothetical protein LCGC14_2603210 [marine sediment metagenome]|uniref:Uncharacterized protein n=1 Tax=marine sediment metagenome TaxID=412755 RepID=A0A0F9AVW2_9ZZZZ